MNVGQQSNRETVSFGLTASEAQELICGIRPLQETHNKSQGLISMKCWQITSIEKRHKKNDNHVTL